MTADFAGQRVLVTGGAGFIGSHLVRQLLQEGADEVIVVDSLRYGDPANLGQESRRVRLVRHTLGRSPADELRDAMSGVSTVFHLAAEKHNQCKDTPTEYLRANVDGTYAVYEAAALHKVRRVVYTSSLYAYGRLSGPPMDEGEVPLPHTVYGITKLTGEHLLRHFIRSRGLSGVALRYFFIYGPRQYAGMGYKSVIVKNFEQLLRGEPPTVYGDGQQALDYVFVDDAVAATIAAGRSEVNDAVLNVASGQAVTVRGLIDLMQQVAGTRLPVVTQPPDWTAGSHRVGAAGRIHAALGWRARTPLAAGLGQVYEWLRQQQSAGPGDLAPTSENG